MVRLLVYSLQIYFSERERCNRNGRRVITSEVSVLPLTPHLSNAPTAPAYTAVLLIDLDYMKEQSRQSAALPQLISTDLPKRSDHS